MELNMRTRTLSLAYASFVFLLTTPMTACVLDATAPGDCEVGATRQADDGCNTCECTEDGDWACTEAACPPTQCAGDAGVVCAPIFDECHCSWRCGDPASDHTAEDVCAVGCGPIVNTPPVCECSGEVCAPAPPTVCIVGQMRPAEDGCNICECMEDGAWACTDLACPEPLCSPEDEESCVAVFNSCTCSYTCLPTAADPIDGCPDRQCPAIEMPDPSCECVGDICQLGPPLICEPGARRPAEDGCNTCECTAEGQWACTERACPGPVCEAADGCEAVFHRCNCEWVCVTPGTPMPACEEGDVVCAEPELRHAPQCECVDGQCAVAPECEPGVFFEAENGQSCACNDAGHWECVCSEPAPGGRCICGPDGQWDCGMNQECVPGAERPAEDGCNTCVCGDDGAWACTDRACPEPICEAANECAAYYDGCNCQWECGPRDRPEPLVACDVVCEEPGPAPACTCVGGECEIAPPAECAPGDHLAADNGQSCRCTDEGRWLCLCSTPTPEGECFCSPGGVWACAASPECAPGDRFEAENGQSCECADDGTWACLCAEPAPAGSCLCRGGAWDCPVPG